MIVSEPIGRGLLKLHHRLDTTMPAPEFANLWAQELKGCVTVAGASPTPISPLILAEDELNSFMAAYEIILGLCKRELLRLGENWEERAYKLGYPSADFMFLHDGAQDDEVLYSLFTRPDVLLTRDGPRILEINVGFAVGGPTEVHQMNRAWQIAYGGLYLSPDPLAARAELIKSILQETGKESVGVIGANPASMNHAVPRRYLAVEIDYLRRQGLPVDFLSPQRIIGEQRVDWSRWLGLRRYTKHRWRTMGFAPEIALKMFRSGCYPITSHVGELLASKSLLGLLWQGTSVRLSESELALIRHLIPWGAPLVAGECVGPSGEGIDLLRFLVSHRTKLVVKRGVGQTGEQVHFGADSSPSAWRDLCSAAIAERGWVVQEALVPERVKLDVLHPGRDLVSAEEFQVIVSPMFHGTRAHGIYARAGALSSHLVTGKGVGDIEFSAVAIR